MASTTAASLSELQPIDAFPYALYVERWSPRAQYKRYRTEGDMKGAYTNLRQQSWYRDCVIKKFKFNFETSEWENFNG